LGFEIIKAGLGGDEDGFYDRHRIRAWGSTGNLRGEECEEDGKKVGQLIGSSLHFHRELSY
jgi:hypothetical protein